MTFLVEVPIVIAGMRAIWLGGNDRSFSCFTEAADNSFVGVERLVCDQGIGFDPGKECIGAIEIMGLARREVKSCWVTKGVHSGMDFGAQSAS